MTAYGVTTGEAQAVTVDPALELAFQQTVPRHFVHRAAVAEVFLTDTVALGGDRFLIGAQWPRDHALYHPDGQGLSDPLLFAETIRQSLVCLAHRYYDVPLTHRFVGTGMDFTITDPEALLVGTGPQRAVLSGEWTWVGNRPPRRFGMRLEVVLSLAGRECGRGSLTVVAVDERTYRTLRGRGGGGRPDGSGDAFGGGPDGAPGAPGVPGVPGVPGAPGAPAVAVRRRIRPPLVGRLRTKDSVLAAGPADGEWQLLVDPGHAILFDHPTDHVPLMALLEGVRQLGHLLVHQPVSRPGGGGGTRADARTLLAVDTRCLAFAELDAPITLVVRGGAGSPGRPGVRS